MDLQTYIKTVGEKEVCAMSDTGAGTVAHWLYMTRKPSTKAAAKLIKASRGILSWDSIYAPYFKD